MRFRNAASRSRHSSVPGTNRMTNEFILTVPMEQARNQRWFAMSPLIGTGHLMALLLLQPLAACLTAFPKALHG
jgi:hypothetical protein